MRRSLLVGLLLLGLTAPLLAGACSSQGKGEEGIGDISENINLNKKTTGQTFKLDPDGTVAISVKASSGTPYTWKVTNSDSAVLAKSGSEKTDKADKPGGLVTTTYNYQAKKLGTSELTFALTSITDPADAPITLTTTIKVKKH